MPPRPSKDIKIAAVLIACFVPFVYVGLSLFVGEFLVLSTKRLIAYSCVFLLLNFMAYRIYKLSNIFRRITIALLAFHVLSLMLGLIVGFSVNIKLALAAIDKVGLY